MADDDARVTGVVVPDDISDLARDIAAYRREVRRARRAGRLHRLLSRRGMVPALVLAGATLIAGVAAALLSVMAPRTVVPPPAPAKLASPTQAPGTIGGLLPTATLRAQDGSAISTESPTLRPEVFALVPARCDCDALLNQLAGQAYSENLRLAIVVPAAPDDATASFATALNRGRPSIYFDPSATIATAVAAHGITIVLVDRDGTIYDIEKDISDAMSTSLDAALQSMLLPGRAAQN